MFTHDSWMGFGGGFMWLFWIALIFVIVMVGKNMITNANSSSTPDKDDTPLTILKKRFALGEIDEEEFKRRSKELEK